MRKVDMMMLFLKNTHFKIYSVKHHKKKGKLLE